MEDIQRVRFRISMTDDCINVLSGRFGERTRIIWKQIGLNGSVGSSAMDMEENKSRTICDHLADSLRSTKIPFLCSMNENISPDKK